MKKINKKDVCILIMLLIIIGLVVYILLTSTHKKNDFLNDMLNLQANLSYYIGEIKSDTFDAYSNEQIITGKAEENEIKNYNDKILVPLVDEKTKEEKNGKIYYKLINKNVKEVLKVDIEKYSNVDFYVQDGMFLRVKVNNHPSWWNKSFDSLKIH